jgi:hypothetical protein
MLWFEREVVGALMTAADQPTQSAVEAFVDGSLRAMPEVIRLGSIAGSLTLGAYSRYLAVAGLLDRNDPAALRERLDAWETSPLGPIRQYVRLFRALVLFGENELDGTQAADPTAGAGKELVS